MPLREANIYFIGLFEEYLVISKPGAELWAGLDGPGPAHIDSWPAQSEIKKYNKILLCIVKHGYYFMWCISSITCYVKNSKIISKPDNFKI